MLGVIDEEVVALAVKEGLTVLDGVMEAVAEGEAVTEGVVLGDGATQLTLRSTP